MTVSEFRVACELHAAQMAALDAEILALPLASPHRMALCFKKMAALDQWEQRLISDPTVR